MTTLLTSIAQPTSTETRDVQIIRETHEGVLKSRMQAAQSVKNPKVVQLVEAGKKEQIKTDRKKVLPDQDATATSVADSTNEDLVSAAGEQVVAESEKALNLPTDGFAASESKFNPIFGLPLLLLLGGGGGGSGGIAPTTLTNFNGLVLDGYIRDATVYLDSNNDGLQSPGESVTISTPTGTFSVQGLAAAPFIGYGGTDTATGLPNLLALYAPAGYSILSPLTSLIYFASLQAGISAADAQSLIKAALGLSASIDLATFDPFSTPTSNASLAVQKVTAEVAIALSLAPDAATQSLWLQGLAQQAASKAASGLTLDLNSAALFQSVGIPTAMAQKVADIYRLIQAADTIADVTTIQRAALDSGNDAPMYLTKLITATMAENSAIGTLLTTVTAIDPDQGNSVSYTLVGPDAAKLSINSMGEIRLAVIPDFEGQTSFSFTVVASDVSGAFSSKAGTVNIIDINDLPALIGGPLANQSATQNAAFLAQIPAGAFGPADAANTLTLTAAMANGSALPAWLSFNAATRTFTGTPGDPQVGSVDVKVIATDAAGNVGSGTFNILVANVNDAFTGGVSISGSVAQNATLTASNNLADLDGLGTVSYQWRADGMDITGATASSLSLSEAQVGKTITVTASYTDGRGTLEAVTSSATGAVANVNDAPTGSLSISGSATEGQLLTVDSTTLNDTDGLGLLNYQWQRSADGNTGWFDIGSATAGNYLLVNADSNMFVRVVTTYTDGGGTTEGVISSVTPRVINVLAAPTVSLAFDTGSSFSDHITRDASLNISAPEAGAAIQFSIDSGIIWAASFTAVEGINTVDVRQVDGFGNVSPATTLSFTLDTTASVSLAVITDAQDSTPPTIGSVSNGGASDETALVLSGTVDAAFSAVAGDKVVVYDAGIEIGIAVVTGFAWAFTTPTLADTLHSFTVIVRDAAGSLGDESVEYFVVTDTTPPLAPPAPTLDAASDQGFSSTDNLTSDATPTINVSATLNDGEVLHLYLTSGSGTVEVATFGIPGGATSPLMLTGSYTPGAGLADGSYTFSTQLTDAAGNASTSVAGTPVVIDTAISTSQATVDQARDDIGLFIGLIGHLDTDVTPYANQSVTNDTVLSLSGSLYDNTPANPISLASGEKVAIYDDGTFLGYADAGTSATTWAYEANISGDGTHALTARVVRTSGASGDESATLQVVLSTTVQDVSLDFHSGPSGSIIDVSSAGIFTLVDTAPGTPTLDAFALSNFDAATLTTNEVLAISGSFLGSINSAAMVATAINNALTANTGSFDAGANLVLLLKDLNSPDDSTVWRYQDGINGGTADGLVGTGELSRLGEMTYASGSGLELLLAENFKLQP